MQTQTPHLAPVGWSDIGNYFGSGAYGLNYNENSVDVHFRAGRRVGDPAVIPYPTKEQREQQLIYLLGLCRKMGVEEPRIALISCSEKVNPKHFPCTVDYQELVEKTKTGVFGPCIVDGPLDLKTSLSPAALHKKGLNSPLEGRSDGLIFSDIQAGNVFYKTITLFCQAQTAAILQGPQVPVVLTSRADSPDNKFYSLALACV